MSERQFSRFSIVKVFGRLTNELVVEPSQHQQQNETFTALQYL